MKKGGEVAEQAAEKSKELLKGTQESLGAIPSQSDSLLEQVKETASLTYDVAKDKAAPMIENVKEKTSPIIDSAN